MSDDTGITVGDLVEAVAAEAVKAATKKPPRKPRSSELAKKAAKAKAKKVKPKAKPKAKAKKKVAEVSRPCRQELRLTRPEKAKLVAKAKKTRRTITSIFAELIEKMR